MSGYMSETPDTTGKAEAGLLILALLPIYPQRSLFPGFPEGIHRGGGGSSCFLHQ